MILEIHFQLLGVTRTSNQEEIKKAYKAQLKLWHPDKFQTDPTKIAEATERTKKIIEAFSILKDYITALDNNYSKSIIRIRVVSSNVYAIGYNRVSRILQVEFRNRSLYEYYEVPESVFHAFLNADSKGRFMNHIHVYRYRCVRSG